MFLGSDPNPDEDGTVAESPGCSVRAHASVILYAGNLTFKNCDSLRYQIPGGVVGGPQGI